MAEPHGVEDGLPVSAVVTGARPAPITRRLVDVARSIGGVLVGLLLTTALLGCYIAAGSLAESDSRASGVRNAHDVWRLERWLHLPSEAWLQVRVLPHRDLLHAFTDYYGYAHFTSMALLVLWVWLIHRDATRRVWSVVGGATVAALAVDAVWPVAPPRLLPGAHVVDAATISGPNVYATAGDLADQYGAMPSIHFIWAVIIAWAVIAHAKHLPRARWFAIAHPVITLATIVLTGNHYWMDCIVGGAIVVLTIWVVDNWMSWTTATLRRRLVIPSLLLAGLLSAFGALIAVLLIVRG